MTPRCKAQLRLRCWRCKVVQVYEAASDKAAMKKARDGGWQSYAPGMACLGCSMVIDKENEASPTYGRPAD